MIVLNRGETRTFSPLVGSYTGDDSCCTAAFVQRWPRKGGFWAQTTIITGTDMLMRTVMRTVTRMGMGTGMGTTLPPVATARPSRLR